jgi:hypothetical protein
MRKGAGWRLLTGAWMLLSCAMARAEVNADFSGFASFGAGVINKKDLTFLDYTGDWSTDSDTMIGVQGIASLTERTSLTGQLVSRGFSSDDSYHTYVPEVEWLFLSYDLTDSTLFRFGRLRTPHYLFSESLEVGYSYPWARPPVDAYVPFLEPFSHFDGADIAHQWVYGDYETEFKLFGGRMEGEFLGIDINVSRVIGGAITLRNDDLMLRYAFNSNRTDLTLPSGDQLVEYFDLAAAFYPETFSGISENFYDDNQEYQYHGLGINWEPGNWSLIAERFLFRGPKEQFSLDSRGWYVSVGYQFGDFMPYAVTGDYRTRIDSRIVRTVRATYNDIPEGSGIDIAGIPVGNILDELRSSALFGLEERNVAQRSKTLGVRWDFHPSADLKFEVEYFDFLTNSTGHMLPDDPGRKPAGAVLTTIIMDVVF